MEFDSESLPGSSCYIVSWNGVLDCQVRRLALTNETLRRAASNARGLSVRSRKALTRIINEGSVAWWEDLTESILLAQKNCGYTATREILKFVQDGRHWIFNQ